MEAKGPGARSLLLLATCYCGALYFLGPGPAVNSEGSAGGVLSEEGRNRTFELRPDWSAEAVSQAGAAVSTKLRSERPYSVVLREIAEENDWKNDLVLFWLPSTVRDRLPRVMASWLRNYIATMAVYFGLGGAWAYYIYWCFGVQLFGAGQMPSAKDVSDQVKVASCSIPIYAVLPAVTEWVVESGYTRAYSRISDVGLARYWAYFALYMASVEFFVYWQHRGLHDIRIGYRVLHFIHHKYNKEHSMSPFAGLAFHPLDGILQAIPYCWTLMYVPMHFLTHELLLFATGIWTTNIHDNLHGRVEPIMGAGYHTIHHTAYRFNYGHYTTIMDRWFGTLLTPDEYPNWLSSEGRRRRAGKGGADGTAPVAVEAKAS